MKIVRAVKCSTKFTTAKKLNELSNLLQEYAKVVNVFIDYFWTAKELDKSKLLKPIVDLPKNDTWLSARLRKVAAREAIDMVSAIKERWKNKPDRMNKPIHRGTRINCSSTIAELNSFKGHFDCFLKIHSVGNKIRIDIPIKKHKQFNKWNEKGKRLNSYIITKNYVQFVFEIDTGPKKESGKTIGVDTGIKCLATTSEGKRIGENVEAIINTINRCKHGSKRQKSLRKYLRHYIDTTAKELFKQHPNVCRIVVEKLSNMNFQAKRNRKTTKALRKSIGSWNYRYWLSKVERNCEENCVRFTSVSPFYTSQTCNSCGHTDRANRSIQSEFSCVACGHTDHADLNAAKNIMDRGTSLVYRRGK